MSKNLVVLLGLLASPALADDRVDYVEDVKPILAQKCFACHGALKQESGLRLDAASMIRGGGDSGPAIVAGEIDASLLIARIEGKGDVDRMPPVGEAEPLTGEQIAILRAWVIQGAVAPDEPVPSDPREHWAYQVPERPAVPVVKETDWARNEIDAFLADHYEGRGLVHARPAEPGVLLRRLYYDLIGLPPTRAELRGFLQDDSAGAYERVVDRLLDSSQYGERWGRHWMDVWRYSDWAGFRAEIRYSQRHIWRWRDWIVESLNADKGYDRMILEMLAADELAPSDDDTLRATGFLARNWYKFDRNSWLDDTVEHTSKAFLAMTVKCARCHDHKYDPIAQREYYGMRAIFEPYDVRTDRLPGVLDTDKGGLSRIYDAKPDAATYLFERGDPKRPNKDHAVPAGVPSIIGSIPFEPRSAPLALESYYPALRGFVVRGFTEQAQAAVSTTAAELSRVKGGRTAESNSQTGVSTSSETVTSVELAERKLASARANLVALEARIAAERAQHHVDAQQSSDRAANDSALQTGAAIQVDELARVAAKSERSAGLAAAQETILAAELEVDRCRKTAAREEDTKSRQALSAAEAKLAAAKKALELARTAAEKEDSAYQPLGPVYPRKSTGRRLALARWIVDRRNPLTARVAVNHIWLRHFGRPLVENMDDFGLRSPRPAFIDLLDYLAVELIEQQWSMKHIHRLIVTSRAYRMVSAATEQTARSHRKDIDNEFFWRMNLRRMEAEAVRDSLLYIGGSLDLKRGGPDIDHEDGLEVPRRSLYFRHARERQVRFLQLFDAANPRECYRREASIRPQQAFALVNSSIALTESRQFVKRLCAADGDQLDRDPFIALAFETILSRRPTQRELAECRRFLSLQAERLAEPAKLKLLSTSKNQVAASSDPRLRARENLVLVLFNHNDFVTIR